MRIRPKTPDELQAQYHDVVAADTEGVAMQSMQQYVDVLRHERRKRERYFTGPTSQFIDAIPLNPTAEAAIINKLRGSVIVADDPEQTADKMRRAFPSGTMLFHGAKTSSMVKILQSGNLVNARALGDIASRDDNGGEEGISWSLGDIEAIPGSRFHMAGFMAAPESVLGGGVAIN